MEESDLMKNIICLGRWQAGKGADEAAMSLEGEVAWIGSENLEKGMGQNVEKAEYGRKTKTDKGTRTNG